VHPDSGLRATAEKATQRGRAYVTELSLNRGIYEAIVAIDTTAADDETRFYIWKTIRDFKLAGVDKDEATRNKIRSLREELVKVGQEFDRNIRDDVRSIKVKPTDLAGLPKDFIDGHPAGADGMVTLDINYPDYIPVMTYGTNDDVRHRLYMEFSNRAYPKNQEVLQHMLRARYELATLLGYPNWADYITANKMSGNAKTVRDFIDKIVAVSGAAQVYPYRKGKQTPCEFCDYAAACRIDPWTHEYRTLRSIKTAVAP